MNEQEMIRAVAQRVQEAGGRALLVGGCVRDALLGRTCYDIDCEVHGIEVQQLRQILAAFGEINESGSRYGIYTIKGAGLDIALPRKETRTGPGHKDFDVTIDPYLEPAQAAERRDFTVNAIMRDALTGEYVDPFGGIEDLSNGVLRAVPGGKFEEDPLRVLRGAQFAARFHLTPDEETIGRMRRMPVSSLSGARVYAEMKKALLIADQPDVFFRVLHRADALEPWFHELAALWGVQQNPLHHPEGDAFEHTMLTLSVAAQVKQNSSDPLAFMLAVMTHDLGKAISAGQDEHGNWHAAGHADTGVPLCEAMLARLGVKKAAIHYAMNMCRLHMRVHEAYYTKAEKGKTNLLFDEAVCAGDLAWLAVCDARGTGKPQASAEREEAFVMDRLAAYERAASQPMPDAKMLMAAGAVPGPGLKEALAFARRQVLCGEKIETACAETAKMKKK